MKATVGELRQQTAFADSSKPVIIISDDEALNEFLAGRKLKVSEFYPDATGGEGGCNGVFKIKVAIVKPMIKNAILQWLVTEVEPAALTAEDKKIESLMSLVEALFPGIDYFSITGFGQVMHTCAIPVLKKRYLELQTGPDGNVVTSEEEVEIKPFLPLRGYEWQESADWQRQFTELLAA